MFLLWNSAKGVTRATPAALVLSHRLRPAASCHKKPSPHTRHLNPRAQHIETHIENHRNTYTQHLLAALNLEAFFGWTICWGCSSHEKRVLILLFCLSICEDVTIFCLESIPHTSSAVSQECTGSKKKQQRHCEGLLSWCSLAGASSLSVVHHSQFLKPLN